MEIKSHKFQRPLGTIKQTIIRKVRTDTVLKFCEMMTLPTLLCRFETWTLTPQHKKRIEA